MRARREALNLTQAQVAAAVSDARSCIANMERGVRPPYEAEDRLRGLAAVLQNDADELIRLAEENRGSYVLPGAGPGVTNAHRKLSVTLEQGWGSFPEAVLGRAMRAVHQAEAVSPARDSEPSPLGAWILETRQEKNVLQSTLAQAMGIARSYVSMVETGAKGASFGDDAVAAVAKLLGAKPTHVQDLVRRSRQFYKLDTQLGAPDEVSLSHRQLAAALAARWHTLPGAVLDEVHDALADARLEPGWVSP
jgi:transcriptional regulator with XRE-family HTH domain